LLSYAYVQDKAKLDARSKKAVLIAYDKNSPAYLIYSPDNDTIRNLWFVNLGKRAIWTNSEGGRLGNWKTCVRYKYSSVKHFRRGKGEKGTGQLIPQKRTQNA